MRFWFSLSTFLFSLAFLLFGLQTLDIHDLNGRPGPGYFPLIIGIGLLVSTGINVYKDLKEARRKNTKKLVEENRDSVYAKDAVATAGCIGILIFSLNFLGAIVAMILFCLTFLSYFNKGKHLQNVGYSIAFPMSVFLLFDVWLQAGLPD